MFLLIAIFVAVAFYALGFFCCALFSCGAEAERRQEWSRWCEERCGKREGEEYEWRDGDE